MNKPVYSIDAPDQKRLKMARIEIEAVLRKHDLAGAIVLHTPGMSEYFYDIRPSYSVCWIDEAVSMLRIKSKLLEDHDGDVEDQKRHQAATANMVACLADALYHAARMFIEIQPVLDKGLRATHTDPRQIRPS